MDSYTEKRLIDDLQAEIKRLHNERLTEQQIIGSLLTGETRLFGKTVALSWPDGLPSGMTEERLREMGWKMMCDGT